MPASSPSSWVHTCSPTRLLDSGLRRRLLHCPSVPLTLGPLQSSLFSAKSSLTCSRPSPRHGWPGWRVMPLSAQREAKVTCQGSGWDEEASQSWVSVGSGFCKQSWEGKSMNKTAEVKTRRPEHGRGRGGGGEGRAGGVVLGGKEAGNECAQAYRDWHAGCRICPQGQAGCYQQTLRRCNLHKAQCNRCTDHCRATGHNRTFPSL